MKKYIYLSLFLSSLVFAGFSQDRVQLSPDQALMNLNPSFAGSNGGLRFQSYSQLYTGPNQYSYTRTNCSFAGADGYIDQLHAGIAVSASSDTYAESFYTATNKRFSVTYAQHILLVDRALKIVPSLQLSYGQTSARVYEFDDVVGSSASLFQHALVARGSKPVTYGEVTTGLLVNYKHFYGGAALYHLNQPDVGFVGSKRLPASLSAHASYNFHLSEKTLIHVSAIYLRQGVNNSGQVSVNAVFFKHVIAGLGIVSNTYQEYNALLLRAGYRNNYFSATAFVNNLNTSSAGFPSGNFGLTLSLSLRDKQLNTALTDLETW